MYRQTMVCFLGVFWLLACASHDEQDKRLLGSWRLLQQSGAHTILSFHNNGTFEVDLRIEGRYSKIVEKRGKATGSWKLDQETKQLTLVTSQGDPQIGWPARAMIYPVLLLDSTFLQLSKPDGKVEKWSKIRRVKSDEEQEAGEVTLKIAPLVVNLAPSDIPSHQRYEWICTEIDMGLIGSDTDTDTGTGTGLHPRISEKILLFLNAKTYGELNDPEKLAVAAEELKVALNPFLGNRLSRLTFTNTILTGRREVVDEFLANYSKSDVAPNN